MLYRITEERSAGCKDYSAEEWKTDIRKVRDVV